MKYKSFLFITAILLFVVSLVRVDRVFFKRNHSFCARFLFSSLPNQPENELAAPTASELDTLDRVLKQPFYYLGKGGHCYAFVSEDQNYVIKFHRYASHMRIFPWLNHPFTYLFDKKRKNIKAYNLKKLQYNFNNYKNSYQDLSTQAGLLYLHLNKTNDLQRSVTLIDTTKATYHIPLDEVTFILQKKAALIYPTLDALYAEKKFEEAKSITSSIINLIKECCQKGYRDEDPVLRKNYGVIGLQAIHIDIGDLVKNEHIAERENYIPYVKTLTASLRKHLENKYPELLAHYDHQISQL